ncbi:MAG TPA: Mur ligase family protein, partial [Lacunisphaera sp.]|nr:Mur ligase family protein [Lacunisphaera sp.]
MLPVPPANIARLLVRPVAVFGAGVSGLGVRELLARIGGVGEVYDEHAAAASSRFTPEHAARHGLVVYSPGFAPRHPWLAIARAAGCRCLGELDFASLFWPGELLAITGTNGKTTLTEFLAHALALAGRPAHVAGNVGYPLSRFVVEQAGRAGIAVCEVSSFQAETLEFLRPSAVLWTNFAEDHLERHAGMDDYFA